MTTKTLEIPIPERVPAELLLCHSVPAQSWQLATPNTMLRVSSMSPYRPTRREFLIGAGSLLVLAPFGCGSGESGGSAEDTSGGTRTVEHALGETEVPGSPQRIVSLGVGEITGTLIALDNKPIASVTNDPVENAYGSSGDNGAYPPFLADRTEGIESVGIYEPNLEKIVALEPDLIIGETRNTEGVYDELSEIAPTVVISQERNFKVWLKEIGDFIGAEKKAEEVLARYRERAETIKAEVEGTRVSVVLPTNEELFLYGPPSNAGVVLADLGLEVQPVPESVEDVSGDGTRAVGSVSLEYVPELTGEHIFVITYSLSETSFEELVERPLWSQLSAVREERVHPVLGYAWTNHGPIGAMQMIDEVGNALAG